MKVNNTKAELLKEIERLRAIHATLEKEMMVRIAGVFMSIDPPSTIQLVVTAPSVSDEANFGMIVANHVATMMRGAFKLGEMEHVGKTEEVVK